MAETVTISVERVQKLEALEKKVKETKKKSLDKLLQKIAESPVPIHVEAKSTARVLRHIEKNREQYNARRRELRRLKKEAAAAELEKAQQNPPASVQTVEMPVQPPDIKPQP